LNNLGWKLFNALFPRTLESFARRFAMMLFISSRLGIRWHGRYGAAINSVVISLIKMSWQLSVESGYAFRLRKPAN
jgi:hypothetical protein